MGAISLVEHCLIIRISTFRISGLAGSGFNDLPELLFCQGMEPQLFSGIVFAGDDGDGGFGNLQFFGEEGDQLLIGFALCGGGGNIDFQGAVVLAGNAAGGTAGDHFYRQLESVADLFDVQCHEEMF